MIAGMSICDLCNSLAWMIGALAVPEYVDRDPLRVPNVKGNETTCTALSIVFLHIGYGCFWYNVLLATYYKLCIVNH